MSSRPEMSSPNVLAAVEWLTRRIAEDVRALQQAHDVPITRGSQGLILHLLPEDGARPTELADGRWVSKQAIGQRVRELVDLGLVRTDPDPTDRRAVIVRRTPAGDRVAAHLHRAIADLERSWAQQVGEDRYATFRAVLDELGTDHAPTLLQQHPQQPPR
ncbi:MAG: MarR family winged helix-turn-helix transcriptional regulator [Jiangellales bacterium]